MAADSAEQAALRAWGRVGPRARAALRKDLGQVHDLEASVQALVASAAQEAVMEAGDSFQRLLLHGLAAFYQLHSLSVDTPGGRSVRLQKAACAPSAEAQPGGAEVGAPVEAVGESSRDGGAAGKPAPDSLPLYSLVDVLCVLEDSKGATVCLNSAALEQHRHDHLPEALLSV